MVTMSGRGSACRAPGCTFSTCWRRSSSLLSAGWRTILIMPKAVLVVGLVSMLGRIGRAIGGRLVIIGAIGPHDILALRQAWQLSHDPA